MKKQLSAGSRAFSLLELVIILGIISVLCAVLVPTLTKAKHRANRTQCLNNLRQIGLGFRDFAHDHNNLFPIQVSTNAGGSLEHYLALKNRTSDLSCAFRHFQTIAKELPSPKILVCPADKRLESGSFAGMCNANLSYLIGVNASYSQSSSILVGDRNLVRSGAGSEPVYVLQGQNVEWSRELHNRSGNLLFSDGRAETFNNSEVRKVVASLSGATILVPTVQDGAGLFPFNCAKVEQPQPRQTCRSWAAPH